ncbi:MAG: Xaa-Pro peptidase family protein [Proteobacteria bacterium]|nr:Xaa-Pro peptidase family protein [Pseudomonadota bacterium]
MELKTYLRDRIDWELPFPPEEYAARRGKVRAAMTEAGLDLILLCRLPDINWLTGYDMIWNHLRNSTTLVVRADSDDTLFFDAAAHTTIVSLVPEIRDAVIFDHDPMAGADDFDIIADELTARGLIDGTIGLQFWGWGPATPVVETLAEKLRAKGARVVDASLVVETQRVYKSAREMAIMRQAAAAADNALEAARTSMRPGMTETQIEGVLAGSLMHQGCNYPAIHTMVASGIRSGTHHSPPTHRKVKDGDLVHIDVCASMHRYHVNHCRTFSIGKADERWIDVMEKAAGSIDAILDNVRIGDPLSRVNDLAIDHLKGVGLYDKAWWIGGYPLGISFPPDWTGAFWNHWNEEVFGPTPGKLTIEPGLVFNYENQFDIWEDWPGGTGCNFIETFMVTEDGVELLSRLPRTIRSNQD